MVIGIIGENCSGKSTLARILQDLIQRKRGVRCGMCGADI